LEIREFTIADYDEVLSLWQASDGLGLGESDTREAIAAFLARNPGLCFVARNGAAVVGAVLCGHDGRRAYLHHLAVAVSHRRRGVGRLLAAQCLEAVRSLGHPPLSPLCVQDQRERPGLLAARGLVGA
jgi:N-acetylglutamate synthase